MPKWPTTTKWPSGTTISNGWSAFTANTIVDAWRADLGVTVATGVSQWTGQVNGTQLANGTGAAQPAVTASNANFNNRPTIGGDGVNDELTAALAIPFPSTTARYYWFVFRLVAWAASACLMGSGSGNRQLVYCSPSSPSVRQFNEFSGNPVGSDIGSARRGVAYFSNSASDFIQVGNEASAGATAGNFSAASWSIFSGGTTNFCQVEYAEIVILSARPTDVQLQAADTYAADRYGVGILL